METSPRSGCLEMQLERVQHPVYISPGGLSSMACGHEMTDCVNRAEAGEDRIKSTGSGEA